MDGTVESGARSEKVEVALEFCWRRVLGGSGGDEGTMPVDEVGMGVGYNSCSRSKGEGETRRRFGCGGKDGEEWGSKAGNRDGAGRFAPATGGTGSLSLLGGELIAAGGGSVRPGAGAGSGTLSELRVGGIDGFMFIWSGASSINGR